MISRNPVSTVFLDVMTCFVVGIMLIAVFKPNDSMPSPKLGPPIKLYVYRDEKGEFYTLMYKKKMTPYQIVKIILMAKKEGVKVVEVKVAIDKKTPYDYLHKLKTPIINLTSYKKDQEFEVIWETLLLSDKPKKVAIRRN